MKTLLILAAMLSLSGPVLAQGALTGINNPNYQRPPPPPPPPTSTQPQNPQQWGCVRFGQIVPCN